MNRKMTTGVPELNPVPVKAPWYMLGIHFIGPLTSEAEDGSQYILTITDYFTKWVEATLTQTRLLQLLLIHFYSIRKYSSTFYHVYRDCYGRFALYWPMGKLKFEFSLSVSTQFDFYQHQGGTHVEG